MKKGICIVVLTGLLLALTACSIDIPTISAEEETRKSRTKAATTEAADTLPASEPALTEEAGTRSEAAASTAAIPAETRTLPASLANPSEEAAETSPVPETPASPETTAAEETSPFLETTVRETTSVPEPSGIPETSLPEESSPEETAPAMILQPGDLVSFGHYEQDGVSSNGKEKIEWVVLAIDGEKALLLSRYCLDCRKAHEKDANVTWEGSDIRTWLNGSFLPTAFDAAEQAGIELVRLTNPENPQSHVGAAGETEDRVFLLSIEEVETYLTGELYEYRGTTPTRYAMDRGSTLASNGNTWWWLRTSGRDLKSFAEVFSYREIDYMGDPAVNPEQAVRPAVVVDLSKLADD